MAGKFVHFFLGGTVATAGIAGIFALSQPGAEEAARFANPLTRTQAKIGNATQDGACEAQERFSQQLNSYFSNVSDGKNLDFTITKNDCLKLLAAKQEVAKVSGCCHTFNGKPVRYEFVIVDPAEEQARAVAALDQAWPWPRSANQERSGTEPFLQNWPAKNPKP